MKREDCILAFVALGRKLQNVIEYFENGKSENIDKSCNHLIYAIEAECAKNAWVIKHDVVYRLKSIADNLTDKALGLFLSQYPYKFEHKPRNIALLLNSAMPFHGFYELFAILITGNRATIKYFKSDERLLFSMAYFLTDLSPTFKDYVKFEEQSLTNFDLMLLSSDALDNQPFFSISNAIKKAYKIEPAYNIGIVSPDCSENDLEKLGEDLFTYFGRTKYNIKSLYIHEDVKINDVFSAFEKFNDRGQTHRYANQYDYSKFTCQMSRQVYYDTGFCIFTEEQGVNYMTGKVKFQRYNSETVLKKVIKKPEYKQTFLTIYGNVDSAIPFGRANKLSLRELPEIQQIMNILANVNGNYPTKQ